MTSYEKLRAKRNEMFPVTMKFFNGIRNEELVMTEEVSLNDVLMMLETDEEISIFQHGELGIVNGAKHERIDIDLTLPLSEQEETCKQLNKLL